MWLHYFALLLVVVALARPTLSLVWFVPLAMVVTPGSGQPTPFETSATLVIAAATVGLSLWSLRGDLRGGPELRCGEAVTSSALSRERSTSSAVATVRDRSWAIAVWGAMAVWSVVLFVVVREGFVGFRVGRFDLGNMVQAVWSTTQGRPLEVTHGATGEQMVRLGGHVDPFLVLLAPAWVAWPSPLVLGLAQIVAVSSGALPVFWLGPPPPRLGAELRASSRSATSRIRGSRSRRSRRSTR